MSATLYAAIPPQTPTTTSRARRVGTLASLIGSASLLLRRVQPARLVIDRDLVLEDLLDRDLEVRHVRALDERAGPVHQLEHPLLNEGGQLEPSTDLVHD